MRVDLGVFRKLTGSQPLNVDWVQLSKDDWDNQKLTWALLLEGDWGAESQGVVERQEGLGGKMEKALARS